MNNQNLLIKLLQTNHLNVPERNELGNVVKIDEVKEALRNYFQNENQIPSNLSWEDSFSGCMILKEENSFRLYCKDEVGLGNYQVVEDKQDSDLGNIVESFFKVGFPQKEIDGIPVE